MKHKNLLKIIFTLLLMLTMTFVKAQTTLSKGDIALISISTGGEDFAFVTFVDLDADTVIYFTDADADGDFTIDTNEGTVQYTAPAGGITAGTVITGNSNGSATNFSSTSDGSMILGNNGDGILAYQGASVSNVTTFLHAIGEDAGDIGSFPANTLTASDYVLIGGDDGNYTGTTSETAANLFAAINNNSNWTVSGSASINPPASFTVASGSDPTIAFDSSTSSETETDATFSVNVPVTVSNYDGNQIDMSVSVTGGTAEVADYTLNTTSLSFTADGSQNVSIDIVPDTDDFDDETIILTLTETSSVSGLVIAQSTHTITVTDDETAPSIGFGSATSTENETDATFTSANIPITVSNYSGTQIDINVNVTGGTAEVDDYTFTSPTPLSFTADGTQNITVDINSDAGFTDETVVLTITETSSVAGLIISQATHTLTINDNETAPVPTIIISEVSDPSDTANAKFVEIYNYGTSTIDLSANQMYLSRQANGGSVANITLTGNIEANGVIVIAGNSGTFSSSFGFSADLSSGSVSGNGDDGYFLYYGGNASSGTLLDAYGVIDQDGTSQAWEYLDARAYRNNPKSTTPNATWTAGEWTVASSAAVADMTPGALENEFRYDGNWKPRDVFANATTSDDVYITSDVSLTGSLSIDDFEVTSGTVATINSGISLIVNGTSSGNVTYNRTLGTENWYLVSSPVTGETYDDAYVSANNLAINGTNNAIGTYNTSSDNWAYMQTTGSGTFTSGTGYSVRRATGQGSGDISFTGSINTADVSASVVIGGNGGFNIVGNPYTSHLNSATFLTDNSGSLVSQTLWVWNQGSGVYEAKVTGDSFVLAPAQGFFVSASASTNLNIAESYQVSSGGTFQKTSKTEVKLLMSDGTNIRFAKIYYLDNATIGFDNGFDGETFGGITNSLDVFTHLVSNNEGKKYQIQSLPNSDYETMIIPIGITAEAGKEITFSAEALNLPSQIKVFLEDRTTNTFTRLDEIGSEYTISLSEKVDGVGRFYLHTKSSVLNTSEVSLDTISIYKSNASTLRITGLSQGKASVKLFNILGKQVVNDSFSSNGVKEINLPNLASGVYIVQLTTEIGQLNKKITLE